MEINQTKKVVVIGGGAAGFFAAIACGEAFPDAQVILLEKARQVLSKVKISGGGRCNVTHACFDPAQLVKFYPRGGKELRGPFANFQPQDTIAWFEGRGVPLKVEDDGRMFPFSNDSQTIINCLIESAERAGVLLRRECGVQAVNKIEDQFELKLSDVETLIADKLIFASGSQSKMWEVLKTFGHTIIDPVPSLFTFNIPDSPFLELSGVSVSDAIVSLPSFKMSHRGPVLITHWGVSGPAVLKLSAWAARELHGCGYVTEVMIDWLPDSDVHKMLSDIKVKWAAKQVAADPPFELPKKLWKRLTSLAGIEETTRWSHLSKEQMTRVAAWLKSCPLKMEGKTTHKEEFVTAGGVKLSEVNFKTMESKIVPGLFFAGEVLDIDGVTGGFNFQNAWTTGWLAGTHVL